MDYYQGVVTDYLRADRAVFVNTECCIQLHESPNPDSSGPHWYCDAVAVDFKSNTVFLCEVSYARDLGALLRRLREWRAQWPEVRAALARDCRVPAHWPVRPWVFVPEECVSRAVTGIRGLGEPYGTSDAMPVPRITTLEMVVPWRYVSWNRREEQEKPAEIPEEMRI